MTRCRPSVPYSRFAFFLGAAASAAALAALAALAHRADAGAHAAGDAHNAGAASHLARRRAARNLELRAEERPRVGVCCAKLGLALHSGCNPRQIAFSPKPRKS